ncbi:MAG TPA: OmpW family outer membrane protein [Xylella sp.]
MRKISLIGVATMSMLAFTHSAFAWGLPSSGDSASGKQWALVGGATVVQPKKASGQNSVKFDGDVAPTLSASYYIHDNWAVELWGAPKKLNYRATTKVVGKFGNMTQQPVALSAQYHFGQAESVFRPFVGIGYSQSKSKFTPEDGVKVTISTDKNRSLRGAIGTLGLDMNVNSTWFARVDTRYMRFGDKILVSNAGVEKTQRWDPWSFGFGLGARF